MAVRGQNEKGRWAAPVFPNHRAEDRLVAVGVYRPPGRVHLPYDRAFQQMLAENRKTQVATTTLGGLNANSWEGAKKGVYRQWKEGKQLWELSDARTQTNRAGGVAYGVLLMPGRYIPEGLPPQGGGFPNDFPASVSPTTASADYHALLLRIFKG